ncbi:MAG: hypothetical protein K5636_07230 [Bacteroidales bacterium]|nr:hypothetical protein [Bacteroidales bacterium]
MKKLVLAVLALFCIGALQAQKIKGDVSCLKNQKQVNVIFNYTGVTYDGDSEAKFFKEEDAAKNADWKAAWTTSFRTENWQPRLLEDLNKEIKNHDIEFGEFPDAAYTMVVKLSDIDPGSFAGPMSQPTKITGMVSFMKTGSKSAFATAELKKVTGNPYFMTPKTELRVAEAFSSIGEAIGKQINKIK